MRMKTLCIPVPARLLRKLPADSLMLPLLLLLLADFNDLTGTSQPTLGVLFFLRSPPSRKGATHNQKFLAPQLASKAELPLKMC